MLTWIKKIIGFHNTKAVGRFLKFLRQKLLRPVFWGNLRRLEPKSRVFGYDRGNQSIARYYIDKFFAQNASDIRGEVLEIGDDTYARRHGTELRHVAVLNVHPGNPKATIIDDLTIADNIANGSFDCLVLPQTFQFIYDFRSAIKHCERILKPKGILLATLSGISQISRYDMDRWGEYWRFTSLSTSLLFAEFFPESNVRVQAHGNVLTAIGLLQGIASAELTKSELDFMDPDYEVLITVRCEKPLGSNNRAAK